MPTHPRDSIVRTPIGLLQEAGPIGEVLRALPRRVLEEAEKEPDPWTWLADWVARNPVEHRYVGKIEDAKAECAWLERKGFKKTGAKKEDIKRTGIGPYSATAKSLRKSKIREVRFYRHKHDPNKILKRIVLDWPSRFRKTFEAAASQRHAFGRLAESPRRGGSVLTSFREKMDAAPMRGDQKAANHWANKVAASVLRLERGRQWLLEDPRIPLEIREEMRRRFETFYAADVRRLGRKKADEKWKGDERVDPKVPFKLETTSDKVAVAMALNWLDFNQSGFPGLCFLSDEALAKVLGVILNLRSLGWKTVRTIRERIGLKKAAIFVTGVKEIADGKWAVLDKRKGSRLV
jgi:hypothetical protein